MNDKTISRVEIIQRPGGMRDVYPVYPVSIIIVIRLDERAAISIPLRAAAVEQVLYIQKEISESHVLEPF